MNKWYQTIIVNHKEEEGKLSHWLDDENYKKLCQERAEQLKEIDRLHSIIKEVREYIDENVFHSKNQQEQELYDIALLEILNKESD